MASEAEVDSHRRATPAASVHPIVRLSLIREDTKLIYFYYKHGRTGLFFALNVWEGSKCYEELGDESWSELCPTTEMPSESMCPLYVYFQCHDLLLKSYISCRLKRLVKMAPRVIRTKFMTRPNGIDDWIDSTGRIILLGNAAHPTIVRIGHSSPSRTSW